MNTQLDSLEAHLTNTKTETLIKKENEIVETVSFHCNKTFTTAELWNIQRQGRTRTQRRFL